MSNLGKVLGPRGWVLTPRAHQFGYPQVDIYYRDGDARVRRTCLIHHLVLEAFVGPRPQGCECRHLDGNPTNNILTNLVWGTHVENMRDRARHGTHDKARRTHCPRRHPLAVPNLQPSELARGRRNCLACNRASGRVRYAAKRGEVLDLQALSDQYYAQIYLAA